jgi:hypothetical protein
MLKRYLNLVLLLTLKVVKTLLISIVIVFSCLFYEILNLFKYDTRKLHSFILKLTEEL